MKYHYKLLVDKIPQNNLFFSQKRNFIKKYREELKAQVIRMIDKPVELKIIISDRNYKRRDLDNYAKIILDLIKGVIIKDDRLIYKLILIKKESLSDWIVIDIKIKEL